MIKLIIFGGLLFVAYMYGQDQHQPEQRRLASLERRVLALEVQAKAQRALSGRVAVPSEAAPEAAIQP